MDPTLDRIHELRERNERARTLWREFAADLKSENARPEELKKKLEQLKSLRAVRRSEQRFSLRRRWGHGVVKPEAKNELELHARRLARLQRSEIVAATERTGADRRRLMARIAHLRILEDRRHEDAMKRLLPEAPPTAKTPSSSAAPSESPPVAAPAPLPAPGAVP